MRRRIITIVAVLLVLATVSAYGVAFFSDSNPVHAKWTVTPTTPVFLAIGSTTREIIPERLNASFSVINQDPNGPTLHWLYIAINVTNPSWTPDHSNYQFAPTTINGAVLSPAYAGKTPDGLNDEFVFGTFTLPANIRYDFQISLTLAPADPLTQTGRPYGNYDMTVWTVAQS